MATKYQDILYPRLRKHKIGYEYTSVTLTGMVTKMRDESWLEYIRSFQLVELKYPKSINGNVEVIALNDDNLPYKLGVLESMELTKEDIDNPAYNRAIVLDLRSRLVENKSSGYIVLKDIQPILLIESENPPSEIMALLYRSPSDRKKSPLKAPDEGGCLRSAGCLGTALILVLISLIFL